MDDQQTGPESIGTRLRRLRLERSLSQRELSSPGVSCAYISRIEAGARRPSVKALRQLARKLHVSVEYLETGSDLREVDERELRLDNAELELRLADDPARSEQMLEAISVESQAAGDQASALRAEAALGLLAARRGNNLLAVERLERVTASELSSPARRPAVYAALGQAYAALGQPGRAVELYERCLDEVAAEAPEDVSNRLLFATHVAYALAELGQPARAGTLLEEAIARAGDDVGDPYTRVRRYWSLARLHELAGEAAAALVYVRRAVALLEVSEDSLQLARARLLCGTILLMQGKTDEAGSQLEAAERLFGARPEPLDLGNLRIEQAKRAALRGQMQEAERLAREGLAALADDHPAERGVALGVLGGALAEQGKAEAEAIFEEAAKLLEEHGRHVERTAAYRTWARFLRRAGRDSEALDVLDRAAELSALAR
ncbi:MAG TPA: helix-turn-helix transcriptional regulator [Gaiellaceae bacterium]